jgi:hypothetical protein
LSLTIEERRIKYDAKIRRLIEIGRIDGKEMKMLIKQLEILIADAAVKAEKQNRNLSEQDRKKRARASHWKYIDSTGSFMIETKFEKAFLVCRTIGLLCQTLAKKTKQCHKTKSTTIFRFW